MTDQERLLAALNEHEQNIDGTCKCGWSVHKLIPAGQPNRWKGLWQEHFIRAALGTPLDLFDVWWRREEKEGCVAAKQSTKDIAKFAWMDAYGAGLLVRARASAPTGSTPLITPIENSAEYWRDISGKYLDQVKHLESELKKARASAPGPDLRDANFLEWCASRFVKVYGENEGVDFVLKLQHMAKRLRTASAPVDRPAVAEPVAHEHMPEGDYSCCSGCDWLCEWARSDAPGFHDDAQCAKQHTEHKREREGS